MSLSKPLGSRQIRRAVTAPPSARRQGQSNRLTDRFELQGSNIFDGLLKQNDQGRSLTCVHHEGCLRSLVRRRSDPKVRRTTTWIAKTASCTTETSWPTSSRLSDYSLVKEHLTYTPTSTFVFTGFRFSRRLPERGGGMLSLF
jgi:hypothetical protein